MENGSDFVNLLIERSKYLIISNDKKILIKVFENQSFLLMRSK